MENVYLSEKNIKKSETITLFSPRNPTPMQVVYLSNIDQTVAFHVETAFFYEVPEGNEADTSDIIEQVKRAVSEVLLIPYYFMAGRLSFNLHENRLELVCNNKGVQFVGATSNLTLKELGDLTHPNPSFKHLVPLIMGSKNLDDIPLFSIQVTRFSCGAFSVGFATNHSILDGKSAADMFLNLASICRGEDMKTHELNIDRSCIRARNPPQVKFQHTEYIKLAEPSHTSFTSPIASPQASRPLGVANFKLFSFSPEMINCLKNKSEMNCSSFEALVAHLWRARTKAVFDDLMKVSSVLFAVAHKIQDVTTIATWVYRECSDHSICRGSGGRLGQDELLLLHWVSEGGHKQSK
ncbi:hypothetical protein HPP92_009097 [Vanilla planifolia]|uniref:Uncharacterized protein n=1 Tax=Vanilla planifolia TaxID=51239 RepID=A0A835RJ87_VANPL|nr:hypothetical protein HPP92_009097 [Vanilla planifolia]